MITRFDTIHERGRHRIDGQTPHNGKGRAYSLARLRSRGKMLSETTTGRRQDWDDDESEASRRGRGYGF